MGKEDKTRGNLNRIFEEYGRLRDDILFDRAHNIFNEYPDDYPSRLQEVGFGWFDDYDSEEEQEGKAVPLNRNQRLLVKYFEGNAVPSEGIWKLSERKICRGSESSTIEEIFQKRKHLSERASAVWNSKMSR